MKKNLYSLMLGLFLSITFAKFSFAQEIDDVGQNITDSITLLPALVAGIAYLSGVVIAVTGILKVIDHVNNPSQTPAKVPIIRFLIAGALFSLPIIAEAVTTTINGGVVVNFDPTSSDAVSFLSGVIGPLSALVSLGTDLNSIMLDLITSVAFMPGLIAAVGYLLGLVILVAAVYKTRDHVEDPNKVPLKDAVIRYLTAGALFALPTVFEAMYTTIHGDGLGLGGAISAILSGINMLYSTETGSLECGAAFIALAPLAGGTSTLGDAVCTAMISTASLPSLLNAIAYLLGLVFGFWGILKIRDHVNDPSRVGLSEGITRLIAGGAFFSLPYMIVVFKSSFLNIGLAGLTLVRTNSDFHSDVGSATDPCDTTNSLDEAMGCFMQDIMGPAHLILNFFAYVAGAIFIMIGISRLIKTAQDGPKGPGGLGTFGTFAIGGLLLSATTILRAFSSSFFGTTTTFTYATMQYTTGMDPLEIQAAHNVISAVLQFLIVIGMISFVRGLFIIRDVAEGKGQASTMAGMTHMIGGALAVNMGPLLNAIQQTLGITAFGVSFG